MSDLSPFDFFRQETSNADVVVRTEAMDKVAVIAALMGPERVRADLIPYLLAKVKDADQILIVLATRLKDFVSLIGGADYIHTMIPLIENLSSVEEVSVRNALVSTSQVLFAALPCGTSTSITSSQRSTIQAIIEMYKRIAVDDSGESFYSRVSAAMLFPDIYRITLDSDRAAIRELFVKLATQDEVSLVKRAAASIFSRLIEHSEGDIVAGDYFQVLKSLCTDEISTVRIIATEQIPFYSQQLRKIVEEAPSGSGAASNSASALANNLLSSTSSELVTLVKNCVEDSSWRTRLALAQTYGDLLKGFVDSALITSEIFPGILHLMQDPEPDVRQAALKHLVAFVTSGKVDPRHVVDEFVPIANMLIHDSMATVRKILAEVSVELAVKVSPELLNQSVADLVLRIIIQDEDPLVRLRIIRKVPMLAEEAPTLCSKLTDSIKLAWKDSNWRMRQACLQVAPALARHLGRDYFMDNFLNILIEKLRDEVQEVRHACPDALGGVSRVLGAEITMERIYPPLRAMSAETSLLRVSQVLNVEGVLKNLPVDVVVGEAADRLRNDLVNLIASAAGHRVPNVRMTVAQSIGRLLTAGVLSSEAVKGTLIPVLNELIGDKDSDVKYFAALSFKGYSG